MNSRVICFLMALNLTLVAGASAAERRDNQVKSSTQRPSAEVHPKTLLDDEDVCYSMRVYMFEARDGESPEFKGTETCVASNPR